VIIPENLFPAVLGAQSVNVTVTELISTVQLTSAPATFTLNPPLTSASAVLPAGTTTLLYNTGVYSAASGGTPPYTVALSSGQLPTGLAFTSNPSANPALSGTPTQAGLFSLPLVVTDEWSNSISFNDPLEIVVTPTVTQVSPNTVPAGSNDVLITVTGTNFVNPNASYGGTQIEFAPVGSNLLPIATTVVNATTATATISNFFLGNPRAFNVGVIQPGGATSGVLSFTVVAPSITSISPSPITARNTPITVTVTGANFLANGPIPPTPSTVLINDVVLPTTFVSATSLTASYTPSTAGVFPFQVENPNGVFSNTINVNVLPSPVITNVTPSPFPDGTLTVTGSNFTNTMVILFNGQALRTTFVNAGQLTAFVPGTLVTAATAQVAVQTADNYTTAPSTLNLNPLQITTASPLTSVTAGASYSVTLAASGGTGPYTFGATGLPAGLGISGAVISGTPSAAGTVTVNATVGDADQGSVTKGLSLTVLPSPVITSVTPSPFPGGKLTVNGTNFTNTMVVLYNGTPLVPTSFVSAGQLTATVPGNLFTGAAALITVETFDNYVTPATRILLGSPVQITTGSLPAATGLQPYDAKPAATGGTPPYTWTASGLPRGLSINSSTGEITGTPTTFGNFTFSVTVTDVNGLTATVQFPVPVTTPAPAPQINSGTLPNGFLNVSYSYTFSATGGNAPLSFGQGSGSLPPGLNLNSNGVLNGLPAAVGTYSFSVVVTDADGFSSSGAFTLVIKPQPLAIINSSPLPTVTVGAAVNITFTAFGGVPPYTFSASGNLPPGTSMNAGGILSGTLTAAGTYAFTVTVNDSVNTQPPGTKSFSMTVNPAPLSVTGSLGNGQVGVAYSAQIGAVGGVPPYSFSVGGLPPGVNFANGAVSGTPTTAGQYTVGVTVTDSQKTTASQSFSVAIAAPSLAVATSSLPNGTVGVAYSASLSASGGSGNYSWTVNGLPPGVTANAAGAISGTPTTAGAYTVSATVTDTSVAAAVVSASKSYSITIAPPVLSVTTASLANATAGSSYSATVAATGGVPPYTWSATGLPAGLTMSAAGAISGTATAPGTATVSVTVKDSAGTTASQSYQLTVVLPAAPTLNFTGLPATSAPATQSTLQIGLGAAYPVALTVNLTLTFAADSGPDDPTVQFSTGGRTAQLTIPAGATVALTTVGVQTGTVAGTATITAQLLAGTQNITPTPAPSRTVRINSVAPAVSAVTATSTSTGFTVTITGYATSRTMTQAVFTFTPAPGVNLQTTTVTIQLGSLFSAWYSSSAAAPFGSQFIYTQPFTVTGGTAAVASVTVTLTNSDGSSTPVTVTVH
jgi:hypothetical protein